MTRQGCPLRYIKSTVRSPSFVRRSLSDSIPPCRSPLLTLILPVTKLPKSFTSPMSCFSRSLFAENPWHVSAASLLPIC